MFSRQLRAALDVLLICMNLAIWGACINLTCSLELYSTVRNVDPGFFEIENKTICEITGMKECPALFSWGLLLEWVTRVVCSPFKAHMLHHEKRLMQS